VALVMERERLWRERAEARANELALRDATQRMDTFLGMAGHELKTPLTVIKGSLQLAKWQAQQAGGREDGDEQEGDEGLEPLPRMLARAEQQVNRLTRLVNDLIEVSRIHRDALEMHMERCDLSAIVRAAVEEQRVVFPARTIHLEEHAQQEAPVFADADRIGQVMSNYLTNALKYSASDQPVEVRMERGGRDIRVLVRDQGPGLTSEQQEQVWDRFHRVQDIKVQDGSSLGLGLGLFICRMIVEQHHGQVGLESTPGEGSAFWFSLPLLQKAQRKQRQ
jgi:signal transduction histidine kinase